MKVILLQDIKGIGKKFDVIEVKEGYARNFLMPKKLVEIASAEALRKVSEQKAKWDAEHQILLKELRAKAELLKKVVLEFKLKVGEKGEVFGSITTKQIEKELIEKGFPHAKIELSHPIKTVGENSVEVNLGEGIKTALTVRTVSE